MQKLAGSEDGSAQMLSPFSLYHCHYDWSYFLETESSPGQALCPLGLLLEFGYCHYCSLLGPGRENMIVV